MKKNQTTKEETLKNRGDELTNSDKDSNITPEERNLLSATDNNSGEDDDERLRESQLDSTDDDGTPLNEHSDDVSGSDLDVPGADLDDEDEDLGEEDEENNSYSREKQDD